MMHRIVLRSSFNDEIFCYHTVNRMDEAERLALKYNSFEGIKTEIEVAS
tara:strand:+ start:322 stop:468 length:147 start_codon:yes stop_codon:yes gene_type:complete